MKNDFNPNRVQEFEVDQGATENKTY